MGVPCTKPVERIESMTSSSQGSENEAQKSATGVPTQDQGFAIFGDSSDSRVSSVETKSNLHPFSELSARYERVMRGDLDERLITKAKIIRIFTSSTFTDTAAERNALMEKVYPKLKEFAQEKGYEFQVVDMRWGVRDESTDDHTTMELCLKELKSCQELSTGPNFVTFLGHKYGFRPIPSKIISSEYELLTDGLTDNEKTLLQTWFKLDLNTVPPVYVLQPISSQIPGYYSENAEERKEAFEQWTHCFRTIQGILRREAKKRLHDQEQIHKYFMSVTENEIRRGVLCSPDPAGQCCWMGRIIPDLPDHVQDVKSQYFIDIDTTTGDIDTEAQEYLTKLKEDVIRYLPCSNIKTFEVNWCSSGISPSSVEEHAQYINDLCREFEELMKERITDAIQLRTEAEVNDALYDEVMQHVSFCQTKCHNFYGREEILQRCKIYLEGANNCPLVIYGQSGCGKTSVVSMLAKGSRHWFSQSANLIIRFIGTTPNSSQGRLMLLSVCQQICILYGHDPAFIRNEMKELREDFITCLRLASAEKPLVIFIDSLDQFSLEDNARQLAWLPMNLPVHVKLVVSTLPDIQYECFPVLQALLPLESFVEVPKLPEDDAFQIINNWLKFEGRTLPPAQKKIVHEAVQRCSLPLFIRVAFDEAFRWKSYSPLCETVLQDTVRGAIDALFERIERQHGQVLVRGALAYITAAKSGLTGTELEDLLSCDDRVLDDVYQYWTPPIRRIPPLLWARIRGDLEGYLVDRGADNASVITWYHRQFIEAARARYLSSKEERLIIHKALGTYFLGSWASGRKKPYKAKDGQNLEADRFVAQQPWTFKKGRKRDNFNYRKISELPYHLTLSDNAVTLKMEVLCNYEFLYTALQCSSLPDILDDFDFALQHMDDDDIRLVKETLQLSTFAIHQHPAQLSSQLLGRIPTDYPSESIASLLSQAKKPWQPCLVPSAVCLTSPGGPLLHSLSGHDQPSSVLVASIDGKLIASASDDLTCMIWEVDSGRLMRTLENVGQDVWSVVISPDNSVVVISAVGCLSAWKLSTGQKMFAVEGHHFPASVCALEKDNTVLIAAITNGTLRLYHLKTGRILREILDNELQKSNEMRSSFAMCAYSSHRILYAERGSVHTSTGSLVRSMDVNTGEIENILESNQNYVIHFIAVTKPGLLLIALSEGASSSRKESATQSTFVKLQLWDVSMNTMLQELTKASEKVRCYSLSMDKSKVLTLGNSRFSNAANIFTAEIKIIDITSFSAVVRILNYPSSIHLIEFIDINHVVTASRDKIIRVWDLEKDVSTTTDPACDEDAGQEIVDVYGHRALCWQRNGLRIIDLQTGHFVSFVNGEQPQLVFVNDDEVILVSSGTLYLYNVTEKKMTRLFGRDVCETLWKSCFVYQQKQVIAISSGQRSLYVYDIRNGTRLPDIPVKDVILRLVHSSDGKICVCGHKAISDENPAMPSYMYSVWNMERKVCIREIQLQEAEADFYEMQLTEDGQYLLDVVYDPCKNMYRAVVYDLPTGGLTFHSATEFHVQSSAIVLRNESVLLGLFDGTMELYNLGTGSRLHAVTAHVGAVHRIYTAKDGIIAMTTAGGLDSKDRSIKLWSLESKKIELLAMFTPDAKISSMTLSEDGKFAALEITEVTSFQLVGETNSRKQTPKLTRTFTRSFLVDLKDFKVFDR